MSNPTEQQKQADKFKRKFNAPFKVHTDGGTPTIEDADGRIVCARQYFQTLDDFVRLAAYLNQSIETERQRDELLGLAKEYVTKLDTGRYIDGDLRDEFKAAINSTPTESEPS